MGGAHVAVAEGALAQYWNPAGLALTPTFAFSVPVGVGVELTKDLLGKADELSDLVSKIDVIQKKTGSTSDALTLQQY
jgi:hypothetical protein